MTFRVSRGKSNNEACLDNKEAIWEIDQQNAITLVGSNLQGLLFQRYIRIHELDVEMLQECRHQLVSISCCVSGRSY